MRLRPSFFALLLCLASPLLADTYHAGVTDLNVQPMAERNWRGSPSHVLHCVLWYPADATAHEAEQSVNMPGLPPLFRAGTAAPGAPLSSHAGKLPLVVMSHGLGGTADQFGWVAPELARRGYLVLAVNHPGNNALEPYTPEGALLWGERALDVSNALDGLLADPTYGPHVDSGRIGALGYSIGGETVLALAGARIDQPAFFDFCLAHPAQDTCRVPSIVSTQSAEGLLAAVRSSSADALAHAGDSYRDGRIRAVFAIAPAAGQAFNRSSFDYVNVPVTMVAGAADRVAPPETNAERFAAWLPSAKVAVLKGVGHYTFLGTCTPDGVAVAPQYCADPPAVDRDSVHAKTTAMAVAFFDRTLATSASAGLHSAPSSAKPGAGESRRDPSPAQGFSGGKAGRR